VVRVAKCFRVLTQKPKMSVTNACIKDPNSKHKLCVGGCGVCGWSVGSFERKSLGNVPKQPTRNEGVGELRGDREKKRVFLGKDWFFLMEKLVQIGIHPFCLQSVKK
jgi:hypothetical protein